MKYLAFDIEAANGFSLSSICSIGIVLANENFEILMSENIWINPKTKYNLNGTRENVGIDLQLDKALLDASPDFSEIYGKIRNLLCDQNLTVIGHAVDSDVRMLNAACKRYKLPSLNFKFICSQLLYKILKGEKDVKALSKIAAELELTYNEHNSLDDAWMSLKTLEYVLKESKLSLDEFLKVNSVRIGENLDFEVTRSVTIAGSTKKRPFVKKELGKLKEFCQTLQVKGNAFDGKTFAVARSLELFDSSKAKELLKKIIENGGVYTDKLKRCNCFLKADNPTKEDKLREIQVDLLAEKGIVEIYSLEKLLRETKE